MLVLRMPYTFHFFSRKTSEDSLSQEKLFNTIDSIGRKGSSFRSNCSFFRKKKPLPRLPDVSSAEHVRRNVRRRILLRDYIRLLSEGRTQEAVKLLNASGSMPEVCGRICPQDQLCESVCPLREYGGAIQIGRLTSLGGDLGLKKNWRRASVTKPRELKRKTVAIIGAGPAGVGCGRCSFALWSTYDGFRQGARDRRLAYLWEFLFQIGEGVSCQKTQTI